MPEESNKPASSYYWTAGIALVWNLMGFSAYIAQVTMAPEALNALPEAERALYENVPGWATGAFAFAVSGGVLGCVLLLLRNGYALPVFIGATLLHVIMTVDQRVTRGEGAFLLVFYAFFLGRLFEWL